MSKVGKRYLNFNITDNYFKLALAGSSFNKNPIDMFQLFEWIPLVFIDINTSEKEDILSFIENLEDDDDVQNVYSNIKFND